MAIPALHISLGIFNKIFKLFQDACHSLDIKLAESLSTPEDSSISFKEYCATKQKMKDYQKQLNFYNESAITSEEIAMWIAMDEDNEAQDQAETLMKESVDYHNQAEKLVRLHYMLLNTLTYGTCHK